MSSTKIGNPEQEKLCKSIAEPIRRPQSLATDEEKPRRPMPKTDALEAGCADCLEDVKGPMWPKSRMGAGEPRCAGLCGEDERPKSVRSGAEAAKPGLARLRDGTAGSRVARSEADAKRPERTALTIGRAEPVWAELRRGADGSTWPSPEAKTLDPKQARERNSGGEPKQLASETEIEETEPKRERPKVEAVKSGCE